MRRLGFFALIVGVVLTIGCAAPLAGADSAVEPSPLILTRPMSHREFHAVGSASHAPRLHGPAWKALNTTWLAAHNYKAELCRNEAATRPTNTPLPIDVPAYEHILDAVSNECRSVDLATLDFERGALAAKMSSDQIWSLRASYTPKKANGFCKALEAGDHVISSVIGHLAEKWFGDGIGELADFGTSVAIATCPVVFR